MGKVFIVSGGFKEFIFDQEMVVGCDLGICLSQDRGKIQAVKDLNLDGEVVVVGNGMTKTF